MHMRWHSAWTDARRQSLRDLLRTAGAFLSSSGADVAEGHNLEKIAREAVSEGCADEEMDAETQMAR